jgi:hypothetical protein
MQSLRCGLGRTFLGVQSTDNAELPKRSSPGDMVRAPPSRKRPYRLLQCASVQTIPAAAVTLRYSVP